MNDPEPKDRQDYDHLQMPSLASEVKQGIASEARSLFKWMAWGALLGALTIGGAAFWLLGMKSLTYGAGAGALAGALLALWLYSEI